MLRYSTLLILFFFCLSVNSLKAQEDLSSTEISVLTADSGEELYATFGHTALRIHDAERGIDQVYNWGIFNFRTPNFYLKFLRGLLPYRVGQTTYDRFLLTYDHDERTLWEQKLDLNQAEKKQLIRLIQENLKPENREYAYDFFFDNCTTRVYHLLNKLGGGLAYTNEPQDVTFREMLKENLGGMPWTEFGIDLIIGARADKKTSREEQMFLPLYFMNQLNHSTLDGRKVADKEYVVLDHIEKTEKRKARVANIPLILFSILFIIRLWLQFSDRLSLRWAWDRVFFFLTGVASLIMLFMWFGTAHKATNDNWNLLWASPIILFLPWVKSRWLSTLLLVLLGIAAINCLYQFLPQYFHMAFLPIIGMLILGTIEYRNRHALSGLRRRA